MVAVDLRWRPMALGWNHSSGTLNIFIYVVTSRRAYVRLCWVLGYQGWALNCSGWPVKLPCSGGIGTSFSWQRQILCEWSLLLSDDRPWIVPSMASGQSWRNKLGDLWRPLETTEEWEASKNMAKHLGGRGHFCGRSWTFCGDHSELWHES